MNFHKLINRLAQMATCSYMFLTESMTPGYQKYGMLLLVGVAKNRFIVLQNTGTTRGTTTGSYFQVFFKITCNPFYTSFRKHKILEDKTVANQGAICQIKSFTLPIFPTLRYKHGFLTIVYILTN